MRILVVEDDRRLAGIVKRGLMEEGYSIDSVYDGEKAQCMAETTPYDLIILDIMLPKKDGIAVCQELRAKQVSVPILILTARDSDTDRVKGLNSGANDYMIKPFAFSELVDRVRVLMKQDIS
ncbi:MAG: response regulator [Dehalococcoidia bacterium]|jgi:DNA-binding response OmpR family regulator